MNASHHRYLSDGKVLLEVKRYDEALECLREAMGLDPTNPEAFFLSAIAKIRQNKLDEALDFLNEAILLDPQEPVSHAYRALIYADLDRPKEALKGADIAIGLNPQLSIAHLAKAEANIRLKQWNKALEAAETSLSLDPENDACAYALAAAKQALGMDKDAEKLMLLSNPDSPYSHLNMGILNLRGGDHTEAEKNFLEALRLDPNLVEARNGLLRSFQCRSRIYRLFHRFSSYLEAIQSKWRWSMLIGIYLSFRLIGYIARAAHPLAGAFVGLLFFMYLFWIWLSNGIGLFIVWLDKSARKVLYRSEIAEGIVVIFGIVAGLSTLLTGATLGSESLGYCGLAWLFGAIPAGMTFTNPSRLGQFVFGSIMAASFVFGLVLPLAAFSGVGTDVYELLSTLVLGSVIACFLSMLLCRIPRLLPQRG